MRNQAPNPATGPFAPYAGTQDVQQWEYKTVVLKAKGMNDPKFNQPLNELGRQGWELVSTTPGNLGVGYICFFFKKPLPH